MVFIDENLSVVMPLKHRVSVIFIIKTLNTINIYINNKNDNIDKNLSQHDNRNRILFDLFHPRRFPIARHQRSYCAVVGGGGKAAGLENPGGAPPDSRGVGGATRE
jgi:hypothetical protein